MSPLFREIIPLHKRIQLDRLKRVMRQGSPKFHFDVTALAAGVYAEIDIARTYPAAKKYEPLDTALVINNDVVNIGLNFNGLAGGLYIIPAGAIRAISREHTHRYSNFK